MKRVLSHRPQVNKLNIFDLAPYIIVGLFLIVLPLTVSTYIKGILTKAIIYSLFAMSLDIIFGYTGLLHLGLGAFFGMGSYTVSILMLKYGISSFWIVAPAGVLAATITAAVFGIIALRVRGVYFLMITFALGELLVSIAVKWTDVTGGFYGLSGVPRPELGFAFDWTYLNFYYFVFSCGWRLLFLVTSYCQFPLWLRT